jgi:RNA polymerase sigma-54 factor
MEQKLEISTSLSLELKLTPALIQSIQLLQLPLQRLEVFLKDEIEANPLIEPEEEIESVWETIDVPTVKREEEFDVISIQPSAPTLREKLLQQARLEFDGKELEVAKLIIDNLNRSGYLEIEEEEIAVKSSCSTEIVKKVRNTIKRFEPVGCACYSLKESFKVQMEELSIQRKFIEIVDEIDTLRKSKKKFVEKTGISEKELEEFLKALKLLNPEPGNIESTTVKIVPDITVHIKGGRVKVEITELSSFKFRVNNSYLKYADTKELKNYLVTKYQRAMNLKKAIEQRKKTLKAIAEFVFSHQIEFLRNGKEIRPLLYKDVSEKLSIHESTVSRAVKEKFVQTPHGVFPFRTFFKRSISGMATDRIKSEIKKIIDQEDKKKPLGDSKIAEILKERGIKIARRTIAKYREEMGIPNAFERREF